MIGPCLCGDPYCPSCGNPGLALLEEAESWAMETLSKANLSPDEYKIAVSVGLAAVHHARSHSKATRQQIAEIEAEEKLFQEIDKQGM